MEPWVFKAKLAEDAERYKDMFNFLFEGVKNVENLDGEIKRLIDVANKKLIGRWSTEWKVLSSIELKLISIKKVKEMKATRECRWKLENEINDYCREILHFVENWITRENSIETKIFLFILREKAYRKIVEYQVHKLNIGFYMPNEKENHKKSQEELWDLVSTELSSIDPIRIEIALNIAIFTYEIEMEYRKAYEFAKGAFQLALSQSDLLTDENWKDFCMQLSLLRDYINLWEEEISSLSSQ